MFCQGRDGFDKFLIQYIFNKSFVLFLSYAGKHIFDAESTPQFDHFQWGKNQKGTSCFANIYSDFIITKMLGQFYWLQTAVAQL